MKKLLSIILVFVSISTFAQKKPVKKIAPLQIPKLIVTKEVDIPPPPNPLGVSKNGVGYPHISVAPNDNKFENQKMCTTCDTLVLEPGKPHIVIYDKNMQMDSYKPKHTD